jgi:hypothetical protein
MKKLMLALILVAAAASGCATHAQFVQIMDSYKGHHIDELVQVMGPPTRHHTFKEGASVAEWDLQDDTHVWTSNVPVTKQHTNWDGSTYTTTTYLSQTYSTRYHCTVRFLISKDGYAMSYEYAGNNCVAKIKED